MRVFCVTIISTTISMTTPQQDQSIFFIAATLREANFVILSLVIHCDGWCSMSLPYPPATHYENKAYCHVLFLGNYFVNMRLIAMVTQSHQSVTLHDISINKTVPQSPNLLNSAGYHRVFLNFVVPWKIHISKNNYIIRRVSTRHVEWCKGSLCKFLRHVGPTTRLKIILKLQKIPKYEKID